MWSRYVQGGNYPECRFKWYFGEDLSQTHPVKWLVDMRDEYTMIEENGVKTTYEYQLIGWEEVSREIYDTYKGEVG